MRTNTQAPWPSIVPETSLTTFHKNRVQTQMPGMVKLLPTVPRPDETVVKKLNELAAQAPFARYYKARYHETL